MKIGVHSKNIYFSTHNLIGGESFMWHTAAEKLRNEQLTNKLRQKVTQVGRWHSKRRKSDTTRIWKRLFADIETLLKDEKHSFSESVYIIVEVYPKQNRYGFQVHRHSSTLFHSVFGKRETDYIKVISELNALLAHYNLVLIETPKSQKSVRYHNSNECKEYVLKFAEDN